MTTTKARAAVFVKTPELSPVKTRLAADLGPAAAAAVYERSLAATAAMLRALPPHIAPGWAVGEKRALTHPRWREFPARFTGEGGLGRRLAKIYRELRTDDIPAILLGGDCPQLPPQFVVQAAAWARPAPRPAPQRKGGGAGGGSRRRVVAGPAADGGFYLFASTLPIPARVWTSVEYSAATTLADLLSRLPDAEVMRLPELCDLDDALSLQRARRELTAAPLPEQRAMAQWLADNFPPR